ncbi:SH2 domain-containing adapter protein B isoform X2 [Cuculus canorus]|uniref:SH2 domain-containing adapter protein B isoform X2 n=1 Tax=Cuculus canorus TaxID=55661 RepID=UPI0023AA3D65|nr:SH2 domain-containing adapter protein B isoform X2 [Cuculus canorus]
MAKWLNKYFSLGSSKSKSPPQPPRADYREKGPPLPRPQRRASPCPRRRPCDDTAELLRAYRAQKDRDFEDPYGEPGSSLRKLRAVCLPERPDDPSEAPRKAFSSASCGAEPRAPAASPLLARSHSERRPATPPGARHASPRHRLIKVEGAGGPGRKLGKGLKQRAASVSADAKDKILIADDYSDPFDAKSELNRLGKGEHTGYMEPYEAQRIMTGFQKQEGLKSHQINMQLYDIPYEPEGGGVESDSESVTSHHLRESKLPQDDDRPADEYDQPWEWNKVTIPALAAQFNGSEKQQASLPPSNEQHRQLRAPGGGFKSIKHGSPGFCGILGERIDPTVQLEKQIWYHGAISRTDAENLLRLCKECSYLVRNSQTSKHDYSLSLKSSQGFMHMKLMKTKEKYILGQNSPPFDSVPEVIHYYTTKKLPIKGAEHLSLLYPVAVRTL